MSARGGTSSDARAHAVHSLPSSLEATLEPSEPKRIDVAHRREWLHRLADEARRARANAYAPYSSYPVGAALLAEDGRVFWGVNVENAAFPTCLCAEVNALGSAVSAGARRFVAIAVCAEAGPSGRPVMPCGNCRQALSEFGTHLEVVAVPPVVSSSISNSGRLPNGDVLPRGDGLQNGDGLLSTKDGLQKGEMLQKGDVFSKGDVLSNGDVLSKRPLLPYGDAPSTEAVLEQRGLPLLEGPTSMDTRSPTEPSLVRVLLRDLLPRAFSGDDL